MSGRVLVGVCGLAAEAPHAVTSAHWACVWQEQDAGKRAHGPPKPTAHLAVSGRQHGTEGLAELRQPATRGPVLREHEKPPHGPSTPAPARRDADGVPRLAIERGEHGLHVRDDRLDLYDEDDPARRVEGEDVDGAAIGAELECDLRDGEPSAGSEQPDDLLDELGVRSIQEAVGGFAMPHGADLEAGTNGGSHVIDGSDGHRTHLPQLDSADQGPGHSGSLTELRLRPAAANPEGS